jgi:hypothetical protein
MSHAVALKLHLFRSQTKECFSMRSGSVGRLNGRKPFPGLPWAQGWGARAMLRHLFEERSSAAPNCSTNQAPRQFVCTLPALGPPPARHMQLRRAWSRQQCFQVRGERVRSSPNLASSKQTIYGREDSPHHASSDTRCLSLSGRRRCHLVGICSAFLGLLGMDFSESGPV